MNEFLHCLPYILISQPLLLVVGWCCYRWVRAGGYADGFDRGRQKGLMEGSGVCNPALTGGPMRGDSPVSPDLSGRLVTPQGGGGPGVPEK